MSTDLTTHQRASDMGAFDPNDQALLRYLGLNPSDPKSQAVVAVCRRYNLDALLKHVVVIPSGGVFITRDGLLHIAHRSGKLDGIVVEQDPTLEGDEWRAKVSVHRKDMRFPFTFPGRYPARGGNAKYAQEMALKVAESHALRRAFDINGLPSYDEHLAEDRPAPAARPTGMDAVRAAVNAPAPAEDAVEAEVVDETGEAMTDNTRRHLFALFGAKGITDRAQQIAGMVQTIGRPIESRSELTEAEARACITALEALPDADSLFPAEAPNA